MEALDNMANSFWCMFDHAEKDINPVPSADAYNFPECDYDKNVTNLYKQIEAQNWTSVNHFLLTGYWSGSFFADSTPPTEQACTWVTKYDPNVKRKKVLWTHLPIHAALSFGAPEGVVQLLVKLAPPTLRCADDQRMLPLHLAFRRGASDTTVAVIMDVFPEGVAVRDYLGRTPAECSAEGPNPKRGTIIQTVLYYNQKAWEKKAAKAQTEHIEAVRATLKQRTEKIENIQTAFDLVRCRENQSRLALSKVMANLSKFKAWYDEQTPNEFFDNGGSLSPEFVKELTDRLDRVYDSAEHLTVEQKKAKADLDKTLVGLKTVWNDNKLSNDVKVRTFDEMIKSQPDEQSDISSNTSVITSSTARKEREQQEAEKAAAKKRAEQKPTPKKAAPKKADLPSLSKAESKVSKAESKAISKAESKAISKAESKAKSRASTKAESKAESRAEEDELDVPPPLVEDVPKKEEIPKMTIEGSLGSQPKHVPPVVSLEKSDSGSESQHLKQTISEMTSLDMSEENSRSSGSSKMKGFKAAFSRIKKGSKGGSKSGSENMSLPPKLPPKDAGSKASKASSKRSSMLKKGGSVKVTPTI